MHQRQDYRDLGGLSGGLGDSPGHSARPRMASRSAVAHPQGLAAHCASAAFGITVPVYARRVNPSATGRPAAASRKAVARPSAGHLARALVLLAP